MDNRILLWTVALFGTALSGCWVITAEDVEVVHVVPEAATYETCYSNRDCSPIDYCEEIAVPADAYGDFVNAICTTECFDDLDCPDSVFNFLPGACIPRDFVGGPDELGVCIERCETHSDCDEYAGFACKVLAGERLCLPDR